MPADFEFTQQQINNIYLYCNSMPMSQLLSLCLNPKSGITIEGLKAVNYTSIDQLEQQYYAAAEDTAWAMCQTSAEKLHEFIHTIEIGKFSNKYLADAQNKLHILAVEQERTAWQNVQTNRDIQSARKFMENIQSGVYSKAHLEELKQLLSELEEQEIGVEWTKVTNTVDIQQKKQNLLSFLQRYAGNLSETVKPYLEKAKQLNDQLQDEEKAKEDWAIATQQNTIQSYAEFIKAHPYSSFKDQAEIQIQNMKTDLLADMKRRPFDYHRADMFYYINSKILTYQDLVEDSYILTDKGYNHIRRYPTLISEQVNGLPASTLTNPESEDGNTDIYFFGVPGSGKTCVISALMAMTGNFGFKFDPKGKGGGGTYATELRKYARDSMLPPKTDTGFIQVIDAAINDEFNILRKFSIIEMAGEKTAEFAAMDASADFADLGPGAASLLENNNNKVLFFVVDPTNEKEVNLDDTGHSIWVTQSDVLNCISSLLSKNPELMHKVTAINVILTKSDTLGDFVDRDVIMSVLNEQGYQPVLEDIKDLCLHYDINKSSGFQVGVYPFHIGKFMPGDVYTFDETDALKILRIIQQNVHPHVMHLSFWDKLRSWFNS